MGSLYTLCLSAAIALAAEPFSAVRNGPGFVLRNGATPEKHQIETMPGGVAVLDYDQDGRLDLFFVNGAPQPSLQKSGKEWSNRLYRNLGNWQFEDVTEKAGLAGEGYGMGAAAADYDGDGHPDLLVTGVGRNVLYRNRGDGTFENVTVRAGIKPTGWSVSAGWLDYDQDGDLDLFIVNYCVWNPAAEPFCGDAKAGYRTYCHPKEYAGLPNTLYRNNGDGTFTDVSQASGIATHIGKGMGLAFGDYDSDGRLEILVANDTVPNFLFRAGPDGKFREVGLAAGVAIPDDGRTLSSMGADFRDLDGDLLPDVFLTALANESFPLFRNLGNALFQEITFRAKLGAATLPYSGWATGAYDFDLDGRRDIVTLNGDVQDNTERFSSRSSKQRNLFLHNQGGATFESTPFGEPAQYRGAAFADFDGDGRVDLAATRLNGEAVLYRNTLQTENHWLGLRLQGQVPNTTAIGAIVTITAAGKSQRDHVSPSSGYLGTNTTALVFGLGATTQVETVVIRWPSGKTQTLTAPAMDRYLDIIEKP